ncbi:T9SS type A sorting domain-containing protein, partial [candidate division KSB1 bacterium]|nr:T9SS type A sorting domain-containing protein [candidate division KSB1 bacterium]
PYEGGDMWGTTYPGVSNDLYHPNDKGNTKMAVKFYDELVKELGEPTKVENPVINQQPQQFELYQNYPNPFNPVTTIKFEIPEYGYVKLSVHNIKGREITVLANDFRNAGPYSVSFNGSNLPSGVYFTRLESNGFNSTKRMLLLK